MVEPVTTRPEIMSVATTTVSVATTSAERIAARTGRRWSEIQNADDFPVHIVFGTTSTPAAAATAPATSESAEKLKSELDDLLDRVVHRLAPRAEGSGPVLLAA